MHRPHFHLTPPPDAAPLRQVIMRLTLILISLSLLLSAAEATTYYVSPNGRDQAKGNADQPLRTIGEGASRAQPGDIVFVREGIYRERVTPPRGGEPGRPITYRAEPGKRVFVKGSELWTPDWRDEGGGRYSAHVDESLFNDRSDEYLDHHNPFKVLLSSTPWRRQGRPEAERRRAGDTRIGRADDSIAYTCGQVFSDGQRLLETPLREELKPGAWWYDNAKDRIWVHFGDDMPAEHSIEITTRRRIFAPKKRGLARLVVEGFIFEHCGNQYPTNFWVTDANAQKGAVGTEAGRHWIIRNNVIRHAKTFALDAGNVDRHSQPDQVVGNVIEQNYIVDNGSAGVLSNGSRGLVIRDNVILRNNQLRFHGVKRWEQAGIKCHNFRDGLITRNYIADNLHLDGIWLDNQFPDSRVSRNFLYNNGRAGVFLEMSDYDFDRLLVDHNIILGNQQNAVYIHDASGATFVHNLLANTADAEDRGQAIYIRQVDARTRTYHHSFFGNLLIGNARNIEVNYPAFRSGIQRFDGNSYGVDEQARGFVINPRSDVPTPWSEQEFAKLVRDDLGRSAEKLTFSEEGEAQLSLAQWKTFWRQHDVVNDKNSQLKPKMRVSYDPANHMIMIQCPDEVKRIARLSYQNIVTDYLGEPMPIEEDIAPGPVQSLRPGTTKFVAWQGLPMIAHGQLPAANWTLEQTDD